MTSASQHIHSTRTHSGTEGDEPIRHLTAYQEAFGLSWKKGFQLNTGTWKEHGGNVKRPVHHLPASLFLIRGEEPSTAHWSMLERAEVIGRRLWMLSLWCLVFHNRYLGKFKWDVWFKIMGADMWILLFHGHQPDPVFILWKKIKNPRTQKGELSLRIHVLIRPFSSFARVVDTKQQHTLTTPHRHNWYLALWGQRQRHMKYPVPFPKPNNHNNNPNLSSIKSPFEIYSHG